MCAGTQYWAHIGRTVFGIAEKALLAETGNHPENPTLDLPCRQVFAHGQKDVRVIGPVPERCAKEIANGHGGHVPLLAAGLKADEVASLDLELRGVLDHDDTVSAGRNPASR
jgi:hypothetical protein